MLLPGSPYTWIIDSWHNMAANRAVLDRTRTQGSRLRYTPVPRLTIISPIKLILCIDLYGKGYSEAPQTTYTPALFTTQLALLLQYIKWDNAHLVGFSMVKTPSIAHYELCK